MFEIDAKADRVDFWLDRRLPFEPKGEVLEARGALRQVLSTMSVPAGQILLAQYISRDRSTRST